MFGRRAAIDDPGHKAILESVAVLISVQPAEEYLRYVPMTVQPSKTSAVAETCWGGILQEDSCAGVWHTGEYQMKPLWLPSSLYTGEYDRLVKNMENGSARPCFAVEVEQGAPRKENSPSMRQKSCSFSAPCWKLEVTPRGMPSRKQWQRWPPTQHG